MALERHAYQRAALDWLANFDRRDEIEGILRSVYGNDTALWMRRWRWFFLATPGSRTRDVRTCLWLRRRHRMGRQPFQDESRGLIAVFCRSTQQWSRIHDPVIPQKWIALSHIADVT